MKKSRGRPKGTKNFDVYFTMRIDAAIHEELSQVAEREERALASMARILLREALEARRGGERPTLKKKK